MQALAYDQFVLAITASQRAWERKTTKKKRYFINRWLRWPVAPHSLRAVVSQYELWCGELKLWVSLRGNNSQTFRCQLAIGVICRTIIHYIINSAIHLNFSRPFKCELREATTQSIHFAQFYGTINYANIRRKSANYFSNELNQNVLLHVIDAGGALLKVYTEKNCPIHKCPIKNFSCPIVFARFYQNKTCRWLSMSMNVNTWIENVLQTRPKNGNNKTTSTHGRWAISSQHLIVISLKSLKRKTTRGRKSINSDILSFSA